MITVTVFPGFESTGYPHVDKRVSYQGGVRSRNRIVSPNKCVTQPIQDQYGQSSERITYGMLPEAQPRHPAREQVKQKDPGRATPTEGVRRQR